MKTLSKIILSFLLLLVNMSNAQIGSIIPSERRVDWRNSGFDGTNFYMFSYLQTDSIKTTKPSFQHFALGTLKITVQTVSGLGLGVIGFNTFQKPHEKISPITVTGWFVGSSIGVSLVGKFFNGEYNYLSTLSGGIVGGIICFPLISSATGSGYYVLAGTIVGEIIGYYLALNTLNINDQISIGLFPGSVMLTLT